MDEELHDIIRQFSYQIAYEENFQRENPTHWGISVSRGKVIGLKEAQRIVRKKLTSFVETDNLTTETEKV